MAYRRWHVGLHIQPDCVLSVALQRTRAGWALRRWWRLPLEGEPGDAVRLRQWRQELPLQHRIMLAFPAVKTLQKTLPRPQLALLESDESRWVAATLAQHLDMPQADLVFDYTARDTTEFTVTAARKRDIAQLQEPLAAAGVRVDAITPDACALQNFLPWLADDQPGVTWHNGEQWLWATHSGWGCSQEAEPGLLQCAADPDERRYFNPWKTVSQLYPPLPQAADDFAIAIALAAGGR